MSLKVSPLLHHLYPRYPDVDEALGGEANEVILLLLELGSLVLNIKKELWGNSRVNPYFIFCRTDNVSNIILQLLSRLYKKLKEHK